MGHPVVTRPVKSHALSIHRFVFMGFYEPLFLARLFTMHKKSTQRNSHITITVKKEIMKSMGKITLQSSQLKLSKFQ